MVRVQALKWFTIDSTSIVYASLIGVIIMFGSSFFPIMKFSFSQANTWLWEDFFWFFSKKESEELFSLPLTQQRNRFFDYWTLKESYIKAWGLGLSIPLKDFSFDIGVNENNQVNHNIQLSFAQHRIDHANVWRSWLFYPNDKHRIALSVRAKNNNQNSQYKMRFFNSTPLISYKESTGF